MTATVTHPISTTSNPAPATDERRAQVLGEPRFGTHFTDHMFMAEWSVGDGWQDPRVVPYGPLSIDPASSVLHYAQEIFEGLKAYAHPDGSIHAFRPYANAARMRRSAARLALPAVPDELFVGAVDALVRADAGWVPTDGEASLYLRPFMFATEAFFGVRAARRATFAVIASPAGPYFPGGVAPVEVWLSSEYARAGSGGTGAAKSGSNYAASLLPQAQAAAHGCDQVVFLDDVERRWVEEIGAMNLYFVFADGSIVTPELSGSILDGITRDSLKTIATAMGHEVVERRVDIDEWRDGVRDGRIAEVFACGTAAVVTPVGRLKWADGDVVHDAGVADCGRATVTRALRDELVGIQYGHAADPYGWMHQIVGGREPVAAVGGMG
ncbi:branched-chain amino acid aminotransferase [Solicola gregarius]|uniref:Branched-chain-amino-acid aminotransferase n=1 Tax=Solicola gregarius TaxID=2908642 RepID=A0AA46YLP0_9ACTN|nr:branched-chain amino acid aminotransferase [Solicola gregarius]UYM05789.1 branched-chain amino acid aminotransferase [Solicola gregarius]